MIAATHAPIEDPAAAAERPAPAEPLEAIAPISARQTAQQSPVVILGVSRSGTTLLKAMLDCNPGLAIPGESYFIPQLWDRHGERPDREELLADVDRIGAIRSWGLDAGQIGKHLPADPSFSDAIAAIFTAYAESEGKSRFGDKTPSYMQALELLERAFPGARYVHLIRDGRDAALSFVAMKRRPTFNWARPRGIGAFAAQWRSEVLAARRFGAGLGPKRYREMRYERLVAEPEACLRELCDFFDLGYNAQMLAYHSAPERTELQDHPRLAEPPRPGARSWREEMPDPVARHFEAVAGDLLADLGYERLEAKITSSARLRATLERGALRFRSATWKGCLAIVRRSPVWRMRQRQMARRLATQKEATP